MDGQTDNGIKGVRMSLFLLISFSQLYVNSISFELRYKYMFNPHKLFVFPSVLPSVVLIIVILVFFQSVNDEVTQQH